MGKSGTIFIAIELTLKKSTAENFHAQARGGDYMVNHHF